VREKSGLHSSVRTSSADTLCDFTWMSRGILCTSVEACVHKSHRPNGPKMYPAVSASSSCGRTRCTGSYPCDGKVSACTAMRNLVRVLTYRNHMFGLFRGEYVSVARMNRFDVHDLTRNHYFVLTHFEGRPRLLERQTRLYMLRAYQSKVLTSRSGHNRVYSRSY
jgi:hypothetical protein